MGRLSNSAGPLVAIAAILIAGGGAYALASSRGSTITVCVNHKHGTLYKAKKCSRRDKKLSWNKQGRTGPRGATGLQGVQGSTGPSNGYFAHTVGTVVSVPVPAGNYVVYGQGSVGNTTGSTIQTSCSLSANGTTLSFSAQNGANEVTIPSPGSGEISDEGIAHLSAAGTLENTCNNGGGNVFSDAITAIKVDTASP
jgi:hypothetical protein